MTSDIRSYLRIRSASSAQWLGPDRLAFIGDMTGEPQVYTIDLLDRWPDQVTFAQDRVSAVLASRDGSRVVFGRDTGGNERDRIFTVAPERALTSLDAIHALGAFSPDAAHLAITHTERNGADFDLAVIDIATGQQDAIVEQSGYFSVCDWSRAGVLVVELHASLRHDLWLVDPATGERQRITPRTARYLPAVFAADGTILCACDVDSDFARLARLSPDGAIEFLTPDDADVEALATHAQRIACVRNEAGTSRLILDGANVALPDGVMGGLAFSPDGSRLALHVSPADAATDIYVVVGQRGQRLTRAPLGGVDRASLRRPLLRALRSFDGAEVPYWFYGASEAPTLVYVHGGPESQARPSLNAVIQYLVARGISVAAPNVRGSTGYGARYAALDDVERRPDAVRDLAVLAGALGAERGVPVAVMGGSYGGYMTLAAITSYPALWRAAVDIVGIANLVTFLERTGAYRRALREAEYGSLSQHRSLLEALSPIHRVAAIQCPLMVIHGANDPRVPVFEAEQIVAALAAAGREVRYLRYDDEGHGLVRLANRIDAYPQVAAFLERHLLGE